MDSTEPSKGFVLFRRLLFRDCLGVISFRMLWYDVHCFKMHAESACVYRCSHVYVGFTCVLMMHRWDFCMCKLVLHSVVVGLAMAINGQ